MNIIFSESNTHHRGELNYRTSGEVDAMRIPKQNYYANKIMWDGWVDIAENGIHIIGHWNYKKGVVKNIYVISNSEKVKLFVNGKSMGDGLQSNRFLYTFKNVAWAPGTIVAKGFDKKGKETCKTSITTSGEPAGIRLTEVKRPQQLLANGHDVTLLEFEVVDAKGNRCPTALNMVDFTLEGPGEWRGGIAQGPENYILSKSIPVEGGVNRVLVRSTTTPGKITVKAASKGLKDDAISFTSVPFNNLNGLSTMFMADALTGNFEKGPTPLTPSFIPSRQTLKVKNVKSGSNEKDAVKSIDENETTAWQSNGIDNWIEYELEKPARVDELELKLNSFRTKEFHIKVTVDDKEVFNGLTKKTLGYYTVECKAVKGKKIKIELIGKPKDDAKQMMAEVGGKKLDDGVSAKGVGVLGIIETEIYTKL